MFIHKVDPEKYPDMDELFEIKGPNYQYQTYAGVYDVTAMIKTIRRYKPSKITINCVNFHGRDIVKFIANIQILKYKLSVNRVTFRNDDIRISIIVLKFRALV